MQLRMEDRQKIRKLSPRNMLPPEAAEACSESRGSFRKRVSIAQLEFGIADTVVLLAGDVEHLRITVDRQNRRSPARYSWSLCMALFDSLVALLALEPLSGDMQRPDLAVQRAGVAASDPDLVLEHEGRVLVTRFPDHFGS